MSDHVKFVDELVLKLNQSVENQQWKSAKAALNALAEQLAAALMKGRERDLPAINDAIDRAFTLLVSAEDLDGEYFDARAARSEIQALGRVIGTALQYRSAASWQNSAIEGLGGAILRALQESPRGLSGQKLADTLGGRDASSISRKLTDLRVQGWVDSIKIGREAINTITEKGKAKLGVPEVPTVKRINQQSAGRPVAPAYMS
jgi:hypothetical protein